ncbi:MAG: sporulation protein [Butyricicoccus pullicaecorum]|jgi:sporulation protein YabP|nr:sporulation protein [Butyricicoccus pullicaecorum]
MANEERTRTAGTHTLALDGQGRLSLTGVVDVTSFDETLVALETTRGMLAVRGEGLHVERLSLENGELTLTGEVRAMEYDENLMTRGGIFARFFG